MRANMIAFGKTRPLTVSDFAAFEQAFGIDPHGGGNRVDEGEMGRWRCFTREEIAARNDSLDIAWLRDDSEDPEDELTEPEDIAGAIAVHLRAALDEIDELTAELAPSRIEDAA
jgi:type I restriction enzyme M protein